MAMSKVVLQARPRGTEQWGVRNDRISLTYPDIDEAKKEAGRQAQSWAIHEPDTEFRVVTRPLYASSHGDNA